MKREPTTQYKMHFQIEMDVSERKIALLSLAKLNSGLASFTWIQFGMIWHDLAHALCVSIEFIHHS